MQTLSNGRGKRTGLVLTPAEYYEVRNYSGLIPHTKQMTISVNSNDVVIESRDSKWLDKIVAFIYAD